MMAGVQCARQCELRSVTTVVRSAADVTRGRLTRHLRPHLHRAGLPVSSVFPHVSMNFNFLSWSRVCCMVPSDKIV